MLPPLEWHKGSALRWLIELLDSIPHRVGGIFPVYIGDDVTDEDAVPGGTGDGHRGPRRPAQARHRRRVLHRRHRGVWSRRCVPCWSIPARWASDRPTGPPPKRLVRGMSLQTPRRSPCSCRRAPPRPPQRGKARLEVPSAIARWCSGSTGDFESPNPGSNPGRAATLDKGPEPPCCSSVRTMTMPLAQALASRTRERLVQAASEEWARIPTGVPTCCSHGSPFQSRLYLSIRSPFGAPPPARHCKDLLHVQT